MVWGALSASREGPWEQGQERTERNKMQAVSISNCLWVVVSSWRGLQHRERVSFKTGQMSNPDREEGNEASGQCRRKEG